MLTAVTTVTQLITYPLIIPNTTTYVQFQTMNPNSATLSVQIVDLKYDLNQNSSSRILSTNVGINIDGNSTFFILFYLKKNIKELEELKWQALRYPFLQMEILKILIVLIETIFQNLGRGMIFVKFV